MKLRLGGSIAVALSLVALVGCNNPSDDDSGQSTAGVTSGSNNNSGQPSLSVSTVGSASTAAPTSNVAALGLELSNTGFDPVDVASLTVTASGSLDESSALGALALVGDDDADGAADPGEPVHASVAAPAFQTDDGTATLTFPQTVRLLPGAVWNVVIRVDATATGQTAVARIGETIELSVAAADVVATANGQQLTPGGSFPQSNTVTIELGDHLMVSEIVPEPTAQEYVEVFNPTAADVDLSNVYITDATDQNGTSWYYNLPTGADFRPASSFDWLVRFPANSTLPSGEAVTVALDGVEFDTAFGQAADYCVRNSGGSAAQMLTPDANTPPGWTATAASTSAGLGNGGEPVVLFRWDGASDLVEDLDYVFYESSSAANQRIDKSTVQVDGPDNDTQPSAYAPETPGFNQAFLTGVTQSNNALQRLEFDEGAEAKTGGNGATGHDETSEAWDVTFVNGAPTPGTP